MGQKVSKSVRGLFVPAELVHRFEIHHLYFRRYMKRLLKKFGLGKIEPIPRAEVETAFLEKEQSKDSEAPAKLKLAS